VSRPVHLSRMALMVHGFRSIVRRMVHECQSAISLPHVFLKATPKVEAGQRVIFCEPSNEGTDLDGERVLREALKESADYFLAKGNFDIDHLTIIGYARKLDNPRRYEIGRPTDVRFERGRTFVKGFIYQGSGDMAEEANKFWSSLTEVHPPMPWYPSVGGHVRDRGVILPKGESAPVRAIKKVYWNNIGFSREPVNPTVPGVTTMPLDVFAKSWIGPGSTLEYETIEKSVTAGYGTDHAALAGGGALRQESLHGSTKKLITGLLKGLQAGKVAKPDLATMTKYLTETEGVSEDEAAAAVRHLLSTISHMKGVPA